MDISGDPETRDDSPHPHPPLWSISARPTVDTLYTEIWHYWLLESFLIFQWCSRDKVGVTWTRREWHSGQLTFINNLQIIVFGDRIATNILEH